MALFPVRGLGWCLASSTAGSALVTATVSGFAGAAEGVAGYQPFEHSTEACMSHSSSVVAELQALRLELASLSTRVLALEARLEEQSVGGTAAVPVTFNLTQQSSVPGGYSEVSSSNNTFPRTGSPVLSSPPAGTSVRASVEHTEEERRTIAGDAGRFLARALQGDHRGTSGRERLRLPSRVYILAKDIFGVEYEPVRIFRSFAAIQPLVKQGFSCGDSCFIGLLTIWEAKECVRAAGLTWPEDV